MSTILYFETLSGISGDMTIGALLDLLSPKEIEIFKSELSKINLDDEYKIEIKKDAKMGIVGTKFNVIIDKHTHEHEDNHTNAHNHENEHTHNHESEHTHTHDRNLADIENIIDNTGLSDKVKELSKAIFMQVALAESKVHGKPLSKVHFHEVGAIDSIVDIIGTAILIDMLKIDDIRCEKVHVGTGFVKCAHGIMPVPAPATVEILTGVPTFSKGIESELTTPTGAGIIKTLVKKFDKRPNIITLKVGYGLGTKDLPIANVLRVSICELVSPKLIDEELIMIETNIDDMSSEVYSYLFDKLFSLGALDVFTTPIGMKKNRPATLLSVLVSQDVEYEIERFIFTETTTFGVRKSIVNRSKLDRKVRKIETEFGQVSVKIGYLDGEVIKIVPEYEEVKKIASANFIPFARVYSKIQAVIEEMKIWN